jgi:hypothetical protein
MHAVGQQSTVETLSITVAKQWINMQQLKRPAFSMGSDPSLHATIEGTVVFYGVWSSTTMWKCFLWGLAQRLYN